MKKRFDVAEAIKFHHYMEALAEFAGVGVDDVEIDVIGPDDIVVKVEASVTNLGDRNLTNEDFARFCTERGVDGHVIFFNTSGTVTLSTSFKVSAA